VRALDQGADDYVTKPFSAPELARMRSAVRRAASDTHDEPLAAEVKWSWISRAERSCATGNPST
jgi:DNA-binding response OmpR family regulator